MMRPPSPTALLIALALTTPVAAQTQPATRVTLADMRASNGTGMRFEQQSAEVVNGSDFETPLETTDKRYRYSVDVSSIVWRPHCTCFGDYVVVVRNRQNNEVSRHKFGGVPSGTFDDQWVRVRMSMIGPGDVADSAEIGLLIGSAPGNERPLVDVSPKAGLLFVSLGGKTEVPITVRNTSKQLDAHITEPPVIQPAERVVWKVAPTTDEAEYPIRIAPGRSYVFVLRLEPTLRESIARSLGPKPADEPHTALSLEIPHENPLLAGRQGTIPLELGVRFQPNLAMLGVWLLGGVILGTLIPLLKGGKERLKAWPRSVLAAVVTGLALEALGMFLVQTNSRLVLFGMTFDPWESAPVLLIGVMAGLMGLGALQWAQQRFSEFWGKGNATPANESP